MNEAELANVAWRSWFWGEIEHWSFLAVVVALAIEFAALKIGAPYKKILDDQKDLRIAELDNETVKLRTQLTPRKIDGDKFLKSLEGKPKPNAAVEIWFVRDDIESYELAMQVRDFLKMAGWERSEPVAIPPTVSKRLEGYPSTTGAGGQPAGVTLVTQFTVGDTMRFVRDPEGLRTIMRL